MSNSEQTQQVALFPFEKKVTVEISGYFYSRIWQCAIAYCGEKQLNIAQILTELQTRAPKDAYEEHLVVLLTLTSAIEKAAKDQGVLEMKDAEEIAKAFPQTDAPEN